MSKNINKPLNKCPSLLDHYKRRPLIQTLDIMDSNVVNREIKRFVWPLLKTAGFDTFTTRGAWRHGDDKIDVVEFQSFNKYNADIIGITTFSFAVRLGVLPLYVPPQWPLKAKDGVLLPSESGCYFRGSLLCSLQSDINEKTIWSVDPEGKNLSWCIQDVVNKTPEMLNWFTRLSQKTEILRILLEDNEQMQELWGFGRNPSPIRAYLAGYVALSLGDRALAETMFRQAVESNCFTSLFSSVEGAISRAV
jgi:hypothetical protein